MLGPVLEAVARVAEEYGVRWVRRPFDLPLTGAPERAPWTTRALSRAFSMVRGRFHRTLARRGCVTTDWFAGFQITGRFGAQSVVHLLDHLPAGTKMCIRDSLGTPPELGACTDPYVVKFIPHT